MSNSIHGRWLLNSVNESLHFTFNSDGSFAAEGDLTLGLLGRKKLTFNKFSTASGTWTLNDNLTPSFFEMVVDPGGAFWTFTGIQEFLGPNSMRCGFRSNGEPPPKTFDESSEILYFTRA